MRTGWMMRRKGSLAAMLLVIASAALPASASAEEKGSSAPFIGTRTDSSAPIEIVADTLEVKQKEQLAIFKGNVDALQDDMRLRADTLIVHYRENKEAPDQPGISKIEAEGNVFVSSPKETAEGQRGVYDVDRSRIELFGAVVLTQGESVVRGDRLEMNLATGESKVASSEGGGRVRGLFVPDKKGNASPQKKN